MSRNPFSIRVSLVPAAAGVLMASAAMAYPLQSTPPAKQETDADKGKVLYANKCAACHGANAKGDEGPDLHGLKMTEAEIVDTISTGFKGEMPAFKGKLTDAQMKQIAAFIKTLKK